MITDTPTPLEAIQQQRHQMLVRQTTTDELDIFDALHQLQTLENYRGHLLCRDPLNHSLWERLVQGTYPLPASVSPAVWRTSVDEWIEGHPDGSRFGTFGNQDLAYGFWKQVLGRVLVPRPNVTKLRSAERQIWPAITSPTPEHVHGYLAMISGCLGKEQELRLDEQLLVELLEELGMIERDVEYYADMVTDERTIYPGPYILCQRKSVDLLASIGRRRYRVQGVRRKAARLAASYTVAAARRLGLVVPEVRAAFPHLYPQSNTKK